MGIMIIFIIITYMIKKRLFGMIMKATKDTVIMLALNSLLEQYLLKQIIMI